MNARPESIFEPDDPQIEAFKSKLLQLETDLWSNKISRDSIEFYQKSFREYENLIASNVNNDNRAHFIITIPVADRPKQLYNCIRSILNLCEFYMYGGLQDGSYNKITVIVADDSAKQDSIPQNQAICSEFTESGLNVKYFGLKQQLEIIHSLPDADKTKLIPALGDIDCELDQSNFSHKGASIMRNITNIYLHELSLQYNNALIYFIDSDQEFCINITSGNDEEKYYAINYFHHINEIFSNTTTKLLTGKVVGDPPVSPSVMASNFIDDVIAFIEQISHTSKESDCIFHTAHQNQDDASYHDMADLFGFSSTDKTYRYHCGLKGKHSNYDCLLDFSSRLNNFFHGEHPTRSTQFSYSSQLDTSTAARTIYTGNYVFKPELLNSYIAFANLHLRMAGPTQGRLLKSRIGDDFRSANLPMLHNRTIYDTGQSEFRTDIDQTEDNVDLSSEFKNQYFGDVMLFTIDELTRSGYPLTEIDDQKIMDTLIKVEKTFINNIWVNIRTS